MFEPVHVIALGEILAIVAAAALFTRQRAGGDQLGAVQHEAKLERLHQIGVEGPSVVLDGDPRVALLERADSARRLLQALAVSDHEHFVEHQRLHLRANRRWTLRPAAVQESVHQLLCECLWPGG